MWPTGTVRATVLAPLPELFPTLHHVWADMGYRGRLLAWAQTTLGVELTMSSGHDAGSACPPERTRRLRHR